MGFSTKVLLGGRCFVLSFQPVHSIKNTIIPASVMPVVEIHLHNFFCLENIQFYKLCHANLMTGSSQIAFLSISTSKVINKSKSMYVKLREQVNTATYFSCMTSRLEHLTAIYHLRTISIVVFSLIARNHILTFCRAPLQQHTVATWHRQSVC